MRQLIFSLTSLSIMHIPERESIAFKNIFLVSQMRQKKRKKTDGIRHR